jgi:glucokinase
MTTQTTIVADIGGTHARFGLSENGAPPQDVKTYLAGDFKNLGDALAAYRRAVAFDGPADLMLAMAGKRESEGVWHITKNTAWPKIHMRDLESAGWRVVSLRNDFEAATWGLLDLQAADQILLSAGNIPDHPKCLTGPGTGLGIAYLLPVQAGHHVLVTNGAHFPAAAQTREQFEILEIINTRAKNTSGVVFEDVVSGRGIFNLYEACCTNAGKYNARGELDLFTDLENAAAELDAELSQALRLFHEFFGLFAQTIVVTGNAHGGLYLRGGVLDRLVKSNRFDFEHFRKFFLANPTPVVRHDLENTSVVYVKDENLALRGLIAENRENHAPGLSHD